MKGCNFSTKRELIYRTICSTKAHPSAKWIYDTLKSEHPDLSLGTVYRNIALFKDSGKVIVVATVNGEERIDGDTSEHAHFVCRECGNIYDLPMPDVLHEVELGDCDGGLGLPQGFVAEFTSLTYFGICRDCKSGCDTQ